MKKRIVAALLCAGLMAAAPVMEILPASTVQAAEEADLTDGAINSLADLKAASGTGGLWRTGSRRAPWEIGLRPA